MAERCSTEVDGLRLLPCPFCGEQPVTERTGFSGRALYVYCINDNGCPRPKAIGETVEKAVENWNLRTGGGAQASLPPIVDRDELIALLQDLASVNLSRDAVERQARRMADDLIARGMGSNAYISEDVTPKMVSSGMAEIPEDGCEYEHVEAAYRAMRLVALTSTRRCTDPANCPYPVCVADGHCESSPLTSTPRGAPHD